MKIQCLECLLQIYRSNNFVSIHTFSLVRVSVVCSCVCVEVSVCAKAIRELETVCVKKGAIREGILNWLLDEQEKNPEKID